MKCIVCGKPSGYRRTCSPECLRENLPENLSERGRKGGKVTAKDPRNRIKVGKRVADDRTG